MANTYLRYDAVRVADSMSDQLAAATIANATTSAVTQQDLQEGILSQLKRIIYGNAAGNWFADFDGAGVQSLAAISASLVNTTGKMIIRRIQMAQPVVIPNGQNFKVLNVAGGEVPAGRNVSLSGLMEGLVAAQLAAGQIGSHRLASISGTTEKNTVGVRLSDTNNELLDSNGRMVFGLLQAEATAVDGGTPNDSVGGNRLQVSFVTRDPATEQPVAVAAADIQGKSIELMFPDRTTFANMPEEAILADVPFVDAIPQTGVNLQNAYNGGPSANLSTATGDFVLNESQNMTAFRIKNSGAAFLTVQRDDTNGSLFQVDSSRVVINNVQAATFNKGVRVDVADGSIDLGTTAAGTISRATALTVAAQAGNLGLTAVGAASSVTLTAGADISFNDTRVSGLTLSDASIGAQGGSMFVPRLDNPPSIIAAINRAAGLGGKDLRYGRVFHTGGTVAAGSNVSGGGFFVFDPLVGEDALVFFDNANPGNQNVFVAFNGRRLATGDASHPNDVRLGTNPTAGDLIFAFPVRNGDFIEVFAHVSSQGSP